MTTQTTEGVLLPVEGERDIYEVANQLEGYVDESTSEDLARFLLREGKEAGKLADEIVRLRATLNPSTVEVGVKPLHWKEPCRATNGCWTADCILGTFYVAFDDGWHAGLEDGLRWEWEPENDPRSYEGPYAAQAACQARLDEAIRSSLIPATVAGEVAEKRPLTSLPIDTRRPMWMQIDTLFRQHKTSAPEYRLRDELVTILQWARYGEALDAALAALAASQSEETP